MERDHFVIGFGKFAQFAQVKSAFSFRIIISDCSPVVVIRLLNMGPVLTSRRVCRVWSSRLDHGVSYPVVLPRKGLPTH